MTDTVALRVDGLSSVVRALLAFGVDVEDLKPAFADIADEGARLVAAEAPRLTGRLAADATGSRSKSKAVVTQTLPYAGVINYGWLRRNIAAAGYLQRADARLQPYALTRLEDAINTAINRRGLT